MNITEIIGLIASIFIVCSMCFKTTTFKGTIFMRVINALGSVGFIIYGFTLPALATAITNCFAFMVNTFYLFKELKDHNKSN